MPAQRFYRDIHHAGLGTWQRIGGSDPWVVEARAAARLLEWAKRWERQQSAAWKAASKQHAQRTRAAAAAYKENQKTDAERQTQEAQDRIAEIEQLLAHTLQVDDRIDFAALESTAPFAEPPPHPPQYAPLPDRPADPYRTYIAPEIGTGAKLREALSSAAREARVARERAEADAMRAQDEAANQQRLGQWQQYCARVNAHNLAVQSQYLAAGEAWRQRKQAYEEHQRRVNESVEQARAQYMAKEPAAIEQYCDLVLSRSRYPDAFPQTFRVEYRADVKTLLVEYTLPAPSEMPTTKSVKYVAARDEFVSAALSPPESQRLFERAVYQIALRTLHELFEADQVEALDAVVFNGVVATIDRATGHEVRPCIVSLQAGRAEFMAIKLDQVDPKACFRRLKGLGSAQVDALVPVAPVVKLTTDDERYVEGRDVLAAVTTSSCCEPSSQAHCAWRSHRPVLPMRNSISASPFHRATTGVVPSVQRETR